MISSARAAYRCASEAGTNNAYVVSFRGKLANANLNQLVPTVIQFSGNGVNAGNFVAPATVFQGTGNDVQTLSFGSPQGVNEVQTITRNINGSTTFSFNAVNGAAITLGTTTTAGAIQSNLNTIPALNGNVSVAGSNGGPWTVTFVNGLAGQDVSQIGVNNANATIVTTTEGQDISPITNSGSTIQLTFNGTLAAGTLTFTNVPTPPPAASPTARRFRQTSRPFPPRRECRPSRETSRSLGKTADRSPSSSTISSPVRMFRRFGRLSWATKHSE